MAIFKLDPKEGGIKFKFVDKGVSFGSVPGGVIAVDVGGKWGDGIYDHHQEKKDSASKFIFDRIDEVKAHVQKTKVKEIILHETPDIDAIVSAFMVFTLAKGVDVPKTFENIVAYTNLEDTNGIRIGVEDVDNFRGFVQGLFDAYPKKKPKHYARVLREAFLLLDAALKSGSEFCDLSGKFPAPRKITELKVQKEYEKILSQAKHIIKKRKHLVKKFKKYEAGYFSQYLETLAIGGKEVKYLAVDLTKDAIEARAKQDGKDAALLYGFSFTYPFIAYGENVPIVLLRSNYPDGSQKFVLGLDNNSPVVKGLGLTVEKAFSALNEKYGKWKKINDFLTLSEQGIGKEITLQDVSQVAKSSF